MDDGDDSRSTTPEAPPQDLWSSILDSVSSSRSIPAKQIVILGEPNTGKSTLSAALLQQPAPIESKEEERTDFAVGYDFADVKDDADEDTLARLSVYTVPSSATSYTSLLPQFLPPRQSLPHSLVMIVLDWTRPWSFIEELETWLQWVEEWAQGDGARELEIVREENRERLQYYIQHYAEPTSEPLPANPSVSGGAIPLSQGTLTDNSAGVPIIVVCTKADLIDGGDDLGASTSGVVGMMKGKGGDWEERTDGVMQVLRTICLKYGASLFYTTTSPPTLQALRQYALHALFIPPAPSPVSSNTESQAPTRNPFPFQHKPNALDRDRILIPAGWDSWGKISILRDGFDAKLWNEAWEKDISDDQTEEPGAKKLYASIVPDQGAKHQTLPNFINPTPEQAFLAKHYDETQKKANIDPRGAFRNPAEVSNSNAGVVGPLGSTTFALPNVERALNEMEINGVGAGGAGRAGTRNIGAAGNRLPGGLAPVGTGPAGRGPTSPAGPSPSGQSQHEVLQNFFQSLLNTKDRGGAAGSGANAAAAAATSRPAATSSPPPPSGGED